MGVFLRERPGPQRGRLLRDLGRPLSLPAKPDLSCPTHVPGAGRGSLHPESGSPSGGRRVGKADCQNHSPYHSYPNRPVRTTLLISHRRKCNTGRSLPKTSLFLSIELGKSTPKSQGSHLPQGARELTQSVKQAKGKCRGWGRTRASLPSARLPPPCAFQFLRLLSSYNTQLASPPQRMQGMCHVSLPVSVTFVKISYFLT